MENDLRIHKFNIRNDWMCFYKYVAQWTIAYDAFVLVADPKKLGTSRIQHSIPQPVSYQYPNQYRPQLLPIHQLPRAQVLKTTKVSKCLNPKCPEHHRIKDYPSISDDMEKELHKEHHEKKDSVAKQK